MAAIIKPIMRAAGVREELAHPHVLRHTFGTLWLARGGELSRLQTLWGTPPRPPPPPKSNTPPKTSSAIDAQERGPSVLAAHAAR